MEIKVVETPQDLKRFIEFAYDLYRDEPNWVPPLRREYKKYITGVTSSVREAGPSEMAIAVEDGKVLGRIMVGVNEEVNAYHGIRESYFSQYEAIDRQDVADGLMRYAEDWAKKHGSNLLKGPFSLPGGDDNRGFLMDCYDDPPMVQNVYHKPYYGAQMIAAGYVKYRDCYAFTAEPTESMIARYEKIIPYAMAKYKFHLDNIRLDKKGLKEDAQDISRIIREGMPKTQEWIDFMPPTDEEIDTITEAIRPFADADFIFIARNEENRPIAFNITMPDYNIPMAKMNGRMHPWSLLKFLYYRRKIHRMRVFVLFVIPEYRNKGVTQAMYLATLRKALKKGYTEVEGSTIWDHNTDMINDILKVGGKLKKTYRLYQKKLDEKEASR